jgi:DNA-binding transcriptional ArsR family regulator
VDRSTTDRKVTTTPTPTTAPADAPVSASAVADASTTGQASDASPARLRATPERERAIVHARLRADADVLRYERGESLRGTGTVTRVFTVGYVSPSSVSKEWEPENVFDVFGSELARRILVLASSDPVSAEEIAERCDSSLPTVYRRLNTLEEHDLLRENQQVDADGNHYNTYQTKLQKVCFTVEDGGFTIDLQLRQDLVDKFGAFWSDLEGSSGGSGD